MAVSRSLSELSVADILPHFLGSLSSTFLRMAVDACSEGITEDASKQSDDHEGPEECCICLTTVTLSAMGTLECGHNQFHYKCIADWGALSASCPICKAKFSSVLQNGRKFRLKKLKPVKEVQISVIDDYEEIDYEEEEDFDNCPICATECIHGDGKSVFCDCGESVHLFCIGRRFDNDTEGVDFSDASRGNKCDDAHLWTCVQCSRVGRTSTGESTLNHDSSSLSDRQPRMSRRGSSTLNYGRNHRGMVSLHALLCCLFCRLKSVVI